MSLAPDCLQINGRKVLVSYVNPAIPDRKFDFCAVFQDYEPGDLMGWGATAVAAVADLKERAES
jgi:hypothetical protein